MKRLAIILAFVMLASPAFAGGTECPPGQEKKGWKCVPTETPEVPTTQPVVIDISNDNDNDNRNTNTNINGGGDADATATGGNATGGSVTGSGNSNTDVDASSRNTNTNIVGGGHGGQGGDGGEGGTGVGVGIGVGGEGGDATATGGEGGDASIYIGGASGGQECYEGDCGGSGNGAFSNDNDIDNSSNAEGGDSNVTVNIGEDGPLTASSQEVATSASIEEGAIQIEGDTTVYEAPIIPVATAATSFSSICTSGAGVQKQTYGLNLAVTSDVCMHLMMADAWMAMGDVDKALKSVTAAGRHASTKGFMGYIRHVVTIGIL